MEKSIPALESPRGTRSAIGPVLRRPTHERTLVVCFAAVIACFVFSASTSELQARDTDESSTTLTHAVLPAVAHIAAARTHLHAIETLLEEAAEGHPWGRGSLQQARSQLKAEWTAYLGLRPVMTTATQRAADALGEADTDVALIRQQLLDDDLPRAHEALATGARQSLAKADRAFDELAASDVRDAEDHTRSTQLERRHRSRKALLWNAFSVALSVVLGALGVRAARRHTTLLEMRAAELEQFADRVAHDLRGPLAPALLALEIGKRDPGIGEKCRNALERGLRSGQLVQSILRDLLAFARSGARPEPGSCAKVNDVLLDVLLETRPLAEAAGIELVVEPSQEVAVACGAGVLGCVVSNLLRNAIAHMGDAPRREIRVRSRGGRELRLEVQDTGPGIPEAFAGVVFEPRVRGGSGEGLGLGLATVRRLVEAHGGRVGVRSRPGEGATFWVTLPSRGVS